MCDVRPNRFIASIDKNELDSTLIKIFISENKEVHDISSNAKTVCGLRITVWMCLSCINIALSYYMLLLTWNILQIMAILKQFSRCKLEECLSSVTRDLAIVWRLVWASDALLANISSHGDVMSCHVKSWKTQVEWPKQFSILVSIGKHSDARFSKQNILVVVSESF